MTVLRNVQFECLIISSSLDAVELQGFFFSCLCLAAHMVFLAGIPYRYDCLLVMGCDFPYLPLHITAQGLSPPAPNRRQSRKGGQARVAKKSVLGSRHCCRQILL